jgi:hypothetical protein
MITNNTATGNCGNGCFQSQGAGLFQVGNNDFYGNMAAPFYVNIQGYMYLNQSAAFNIMNPIVVSTAWANVGDLGILVVPGPKCTFSNPGYVTGTKHLVAMNGCIDNQGGGTGFFPGTVAGSTSSGGQYLP